MGSEGFLFLCSGNKLMARLWVSLASLRDQTKKDIVILTAHMDQQAIDLLKKHGFATQPVEIPAGGQQALVCKTYLGPLSPFDKSWFLDADTLILRPLDDLFQRLTDFSWTQFANWTMAHKAMSRRVKSVMDVCGTYSDEEFKKATDASRPALNIGSYGWTKDYPQQFWEDWHDLATKSAAGGVFIPDESAAMALLYKWPHRFESNSYNLSANRPGYLEPDPVKKAKQAHIVHYAGRAHTSKDKSHGINQLWIDAAKKMYAGNRYDFKTVIRSWPYKNEPAMACAPAPDVTDYQDEEEMVSE